MSRIRAKDTGPEMIVRSTLHRLGYRYRLHRKDLPGAPDLVFVSARKVVFVHGCFWHRHNCHKGRSIPKSNQDFWMKKIDANKRRDVLVRRSLTKLGWKVAILWECQIYANTWVGSITKFLTSDH